MGGVIALIKAVLTFELPLPESSDFSSWTLDKSSPVTSSTQHNVSITGINPPAELNIVSRPVNKNTGQKHHPNTVTGKYVSTFVLRKTQMKDAS